MPRRFSEPVPFHPGSSTVPFQRTPPRRRVRLGSRQSSTSRSPVRSQPVNALDPPFNASPRMENAQNLVEMERRFNSREDSSYADRTSTLPRIKQRRRRSLSYDDDYDPFRSGDDGNNAIKLWSPPLSPRTPPPFQAYASLPATPSGLDGEPTSPFPGDDSYKRERAVSESTLREGSPGLQGDSELPPFSLWEYLREELLATDFDSHQELKWERVSNFLNIPIGVEKILSFGFILCFDTFLHTFTILPIRFAVAIYSMIASTIVRSRPPLPPSQKADILRMLLFILSIAILVPLTDVSKFYHSIRGQDTIKLYVIFNSLEIADRLLTSIGQDVLDCMFSRSTLLLLSNHIAPSTSTVRPIIYFILSLLYIVAHTMILIYQLTALNVAINAYDNSLLTLLLSNQFVEIKGSVFKKFEKDNLFQITCADIVERFQLALMLVSIAMRNLIELSSSDLDLSGEGAFLLPSAFKAFRFVSGRNIIWPILSPVLTVLASELVVDWLKHAFITKFNHIRPSVYERYIDVLCRDLAASSFVSKRRSVRKHTYVDQSPVVARRLGLAALPLAVLAVLVGSQSLILLISTHFPLVETPTFESFMDGIMSGRLLSEVAFIRAAKWAALVFLTWICLVTVKLIIGVNLLAYASGRRIGMEERMRDDEQINDFTRPPIGEGREEQAYNKELKTLLNQSRDNAVLAVDMGENPPTADSAKTAKNNSGGRKKVKLEDLTRFTMVKRIF